MPSTKRSRKKIILLIVAGIAAVACLCGTITVFNFVRVSANQDALEATIQQFMIAMKNKDTPQAFTLMSARTVHAADISTQLSKMLEGANYALFEDFEDIVLESLRVTTAFNADQNAPQGTVAYLHGTVLYKDGIKGTFSVTLEEEGNSWKIYNINITIPPDKVKQ